MVALERDDRVQLIKILDNMPILQNYRGRRQVLEYAGLESLIPQIDLEGTAFIVNSELIQLLESFGRFSYQHQALGIFLNTIKEFLGGYDETADFIELVLSKYKLMVPSSQTTLSSPWKSDVSPQETFEKIIGENTLKHISFLQRGIEVSRCVGFIVTPEWTGTGFLLGDNIVITNNHVIPNQIILEKTVVRFNYQLTFSGSEEKYIDYSPIIKGKFYTNQDLDYTVFELAEHPGGNWGYLKPKSISTHKGERVNIIQHPAGLPKKISFQNNFVEYADDRIIQYLTSTMGGSSGSPVLNDDWEVVGLHHAGGMVLEPGTGRRYFRNEGISIISILKDMPQYILL